MFAYRYTTLNAVKTRVPTDVLTAAAITDAEILRQIEAASSMVNKWTEQIFQPTPEIARISGRNNAMVTHPEAYPPVKLLQIGNIASRTTGEFREMDRIIPGMRYVPEIRQYQNRSLDTISGVFDLQLDDQVVAWEPGRRTMQLIGLLTRFITGRYNIEITGWWGWLECFKSVVTTLTIGIPANSLTTASLVVADVLDLDSGDVLEVGDTIAITLQTGPLIPKRVELAIVQSIAGAGPYTLTVDTLRPFPLAVPIGAEVFALGCVPKDISEIVDFLAVRLVAQLASDKTGDASIAAVLGGQLKSESTDNYSYSLATPGEAFGNKSGLGYLTGSPRLDVLLRQYRKPEVVMRYI